MPGVSGLAVAAALGGAGGYAAVSVLAGNDITVEGLFTGALVGAVGIPGIGGGFIGGAVVGAAGALQESALQDDLSLPSFSQQKMNQGLRLNTSDTQTPIKVVYGKQRVGVNSVFKTAAGDSNDELWIVDSLAEGPCSSLGTVWLNDKHPSDFGDNVEYFFKKGASNATVCAALNNAVSDYTDPLPYTTHVIWHFTYDRDYFLSLPKRSCILYGALVVDFRDGLSSAATWSDNGVLCLFDYMTNSRYGASYATSLFDIPSWTAAANYVESKGWKLNMALSSMDSAGDVINTICSHIRCAPPMWSNGKWYLKYFDTSQETVSMVLTDDDIVQDASGKDVISVTEPSKFRTPDAVKAVYIDSSKEYVTDAVTIGDAGGVVQELNLLGCTDREQACVFGAYTLERMQTSRKVSGTFGDRCVSLELHDLVLFQSSALSIGTYGSASTYATMRVADVAYGKDGNVNLLLQYEADSLYDDSYSVNLDSLYETTLPDPSAIPPDVTNVRAHESTYAYRLRTFTSLDITFDVPSNYPWFDHVEVWKWKTPIGWWKLEAGSGYSITDYSEYANNGVLVSTNATASWATTGLAGSTHSILFDSRNGDKITITPTSNTPLDNFGNGDWSVVLWATGTTANLSTDAAQHTLFSKYENGNNLIRLSRKYYTGGSYLRVYYEKDGEEYTGNFTDVAIYATDNSWKMLAVVCDTTAGKIYAWINNTKSSAYVDISGATTTDFSNGGDVYIANSGTSADRRQFFDGRIDEIKVYGTALTQKDIDQLYNVPTDYAREHLFDTTSDFSLSNVEEDRYYRVTLRPVNIWGVKRSIENSYSLYKLIVGYVENPSSVSNLSILINANSVNLYAPPVDDSDVEQYEFRLGSSWTGGIVLYRSLKPNMSLVGVKPGSHTFFCNTLGNNGRYGSSPKSASATLRNPPDGWAIMATSNIDYSTGATFNNMEQTTYGGDTYIKCSHDGTGATFGTLGGLFISNTIDRGASERYLVYALADIVVTGVGTTWDDAVPVATSATEYITDGDFSSYGGTPASFASWFLSDCTASQGTMATHCATIVATAACGNIYQDIAVEGGTWHRLDYDYRNYSSQAFLSIRDESNSEYLTGSIDATRKPLDDSAGERSSGAYLFFPPATCATVRVRFGVSATNATACFANVTCGTVKDTGSTAWDDVGISTRSWSEIFELQSGPSVEMRLYYGNSDPPTSYVEKMEILSAIVTARYYRLWIKIVDPSTSVNALVERAVLHFTQAT